MKDTTAKPAKGIPLDLLTTTAAIAAPGSLQNWPPERWDVMSAPEAFDQSLSIPVPADLFAHWVHAGYKNLTEERSEESFLNQYCTFKGVKPDAVLDVAVLAVQAMAYQQTASMALALVASARFMALLRLHREGELLSMFPLEGQEQEAATAHWSFISAAARLDLLFEEEGPNFDADQMRFVAMCCADFANPWSPDPEELMQ